MDIYRGVVEDNGDPKKIGRVRVRILGLHTERNEHSGDFSNVKTSDLPWAEVAGGTEFGLISGIGVSSVLRNGTWVWVLLEQGNPNKPIVFGVIHGDNTESPTGKYKSGRGFCDPNGVYPTGIGRSDFHPLLDDKYTTRSVLATPSGHLVELSDAKGSEQIKVTHRSGSSFTIAPDGSINFDSVSDVNITAKGDCVVKAANIRLN